MGFIHSQLFVKPAYPTTSFAGQTIIVTGSNVGLGKEAARHFARLGASKVILAVRNIKAGEAAKQEIEISTKCSTSVLEVWTLDLASYDSVKAFAKQASQLPRIDVLLENAGIAGDGKFHLAEGHERIITVNVISTFLLALLMLPKLKASAKEFNTCPRLTIVTSEVHGFTKFPERDAPKVFTALDDKSKLRSDRYPISKLLEVLAVRQLAPKLAGSGVALNMLNPGLCHSELGRDAGMILGIIKFLFARTTEVGSRTLVAAAAVGAQSHGKYMTDGLVDDDAMSTFARSANGDEAGRKVWAELCEILEEIEPGVTANI
jgi:NAD(P)-dependent dehydrogenase (short-subunit alcohol dehydrogenase family)